MESLRNTHLIIALLASIIVVMGFMAAGDMCHFDTTSICFLTMCAFILTIAGISVLLTGNAFLATLPANSGVSVSFRLERPPRS